MDDPEALRPWLALIRAPGLGSAGARRLLASGVAPADLARLPLRRLEELGLSPETCRYLGPGSRPEVESDLGWLTGSDERHLITLTDPRYPPRLKEIADPPLALFGQGDCRLLSDPQLAVVGSRNPSPDGVYNGQEMARELSRAGLTITSGLALGVDTQAHRGALAAPGPTLAVLGTGPDQVYPASNRDLAHEIARSGALVSEFPPGTAPKRDHFPRRNRIIAGLCLGVLVVEATVRSGSLITARLAAEQGREVFAIPGSIHNPLARGCHALIRQGAKLVETAQDILAELAPQLGALLRAEPAETDVETPLEVPDPDYQLLMEHLGFDPQPMDVLIARTGLGPESLASMLLLLELQGHVSSFPGGRYCRTPRP